MRSRDADQAVAAADLRVDECERLAGLDGLDPDRDFAELDRHRIAVDAVDAVPRDVAQRVAVLADRRRTGVPQVSKLAGDPCRRGEEEVARAAGRIDHLESQ